MELSRQSEAALRAAAELVTDALAEAPFGFAVTLPDRRIVAVNRRMAAWHSPPVERRSMGGRLAFSKEEHELAEAFESASSGRRGSVSVETLSLLGGRAGKWRVSTDAFPGTPGAIGMTIEDQSEEAHAAQAFAAAEQRFRLLVDAANDGIAVHRDGVLLYANPAAVRMLGFSRAGDVIGRGVLEFVHPDYRETVRARLEDLARGQPAPLREEVFLRRDGSSIVVEVSASRAPIDAGFANFVFFRDVTQKKELEAEALRAQRMDSLGRLAGGIAHDFNNLIGSIQSALALARLRVGDPDAVLRALSAADSATQRAQDLTRQLLTFSRGGEAQAAAVDPNTVISEALELLQVSGERIELSSELDPDAGKIWIDPSQLHQVVHNLLLNARDAVRGRGSIRIKTARSWRDADPAVPASRPGDWIVIQVEDSGQGMTQETRARIFEPFFTTKPSGEGTGLGLSTVYGIVRQAGGFIEVESRLGAGTSFRVFLPPLGVSSLPPASTTRVDPNKRARVLVSDDEARLATLTAGLLEQHGFEADTVGSGPETLERLNAAHYDVLLLDVNLAGLGAVELLAELGARELGLPVVLTSGYAEEDLPSDLLKHPLVVGYLAKPYPVERLVESMGRAARARTRIDAATSPR